MSEPTTRLHQAAETDPRINDLRWTTYRGLDHLWLGQSTACGRNLHNLAPADARPYCPICLAYARGWLDRHDHGPAPELGKPDPRRYPLAVADALLGPETP
jgi:hypothetical protein